MDLKPSAVWELASVMATTRREREPTAAATVSRVDADGSVWVRLVGSDIETPVNGGTSASVVAGDGVTVSIAKGRCSITGNDTSPSAGVGMLRSVSNELGGAIQGVEELVADKATVRELNAARAVIGELEVDTAKIHHLEADEIEASVAYIADLRADNVLATNLVAANAYINALVAGDTTTESLIAANGFIQSLIANDVTAESIDVVSGYIGTLVSDEITAEQISAATAYVGELTADNITTTDLTAASAYVDALLAGSVTASSLIADVAKVTNLTADELAATTAYITALTAASVTAGDVTASTAFINALAADEVTASSIEAVTAYVESLIAGSVSASDLVADHATIGDLDANYAHITQLESGTAIIDNASISYANVTDLAAHYAGIDLANVDNAWIDRGVLRDASVSDAKIIGLSASKLTAGTIDASRINVTNLNASNITVGTINGQRIGDGSIDLEKLSDSVYTADEIDAMVGDIDRRLDSAIETWTGSVVPSLYSYPASNWSTTDYASHVGDVYYVTNPDSEADGQSYRFAYDRSTNTYRWSLVQDTAVTAALARIVAAEGDISALKSFDTELSRWKTATDSEVTSLISSTTSLEAWLGLAITDTLMLWRCTSTETPPELPSQPVLNEGHTIIDSSGDVVNDDEGDDVVTEGASSVWTVTIPVYDPNTPYYWYTWQQRQTDDTFRWTDPVYDRTVSETQRDAKSALSLLALKVDTSVFNEVAQTVDSNSATITSLATTVATKADGSTVTTLSNTVNSVQQTANSNAASITSLQSTVQENYSDLSERYSEVEQGLEGLTSTVGTLEQTVDGSASRLESAETSITQLSDSLELKASRTEVQETIADAVITAGGLRYDHTFTNVGDLYTFTASVMRGERDITALVDPDRFVWWIRTEDDAYLHSRGVSTTIDAGELGYRASVVGGLEEYLDAFLADDAGNAIIVSTGERVLVHSGLEA